MIKCKELHIDLHFLYGFRACLNGSI
jgi:hypothetical protein